MTNGQSDASKKSCEEVFKAIIYTEDPEEKRNPLQLAFRAIRFEDSDVVYAGISKFWFNRETKEWCPTRVGSSGYFPANVWEQGCDQLKVAIDGVSRVIADRGLSTGRVGDADVDATGRGASSVNAHVGSGRDTYNPRQSGSKAFGLQASQKAYKRPSNIFEEDHKTIYAAGINKATTQDEVKAHTRGPYKKRIATNTAEHVSGTAGAPICISD